MMISYKQRRILLPTTPTTQARRVLDGDLQKDGACFQALELPVPSSTIQDKPQPEKHQLLNFSRNAMLFAWLVALIWPKAEDRTDEMIMWTERFLVPSRYLI